MRVRCKESGDETLKVKGAQKVKSPQSIGDGRGERLIGGCCLDRFIPCLHLRGLGSRDGLRGGGSRVGEGGKCH